MVIIFLIIEIIRNIKDPEKPFTIEELGVVWEECVTIVKSFIK